MATLFTKIINGEIPGEIVAETEDVVALRDINPQAPTHVLIVPRREIASINDVEDSDAELVGKMVLLAQSIARETGFSEDGYRLVFNVGGNGGQTVDHIHLHLLGGRQMTWPPG